MRTPRHPSPAPGFTLMEAVVTIAITTFVALAAATLQRDLITTGSLLRGSLTAQQDVRKAFKDFTGALRTASTGEDGSYAVLSPTSTSLTFYADVDGDGATEKYRYFLSGTNLQKGVTKPSNGAYNGTETVSTVIGEMANGSTPIFQYYDDTYDGTSAALSSPPDAHDVRLVKITVIVDRNGTTKPPGPQTYTTQVMIRSLKDNL